METVRVPGDLTRATRHWTDTEMRSAPKVRITNVVSTYNVCGFPPLDLAALARALPGMFSPARFAAPSIRIDASCTLIFDTGNAVCPGSPSKAASRNAASQVARVLLSLGIPAEVRHFAVRNVVGCCEAGFGVDLDTLAKAYPVEAKVLLVVFALRHLTSFSTGPSPSLASTL